MLHRLSAVQVKSLKAPGYYADGGNLYLQVTRPSCSAETEHASQGKKAKVPSTTKSWIFRFTLNVRTRDMGLGRFPTVSLDRAREMAERCRRQVAEGLDPIEVRDRERKAAQVALAKARTFEQCAKAYIASHEASWRNAKHRQQWANTLKTYAYPLIGKLPVAAVDTDLVVQVLQPLWTKKPETA